MMHDKFRKERKKNNLRQQEVAQAIGVSRLVYNRIELGKRLPRPEEIKALSELFRKPIDYFF
ncbi:helix-turn-helix transcriptional regulator [Priestia flexa]|uniref:helix-turn-helix transcriptional regulator n=1 Tax=Priestia flexa TaxID=86664 RepID=UPI003D0336ED